MFSLVYLKMLLAVSQVTYREQKECKGGKLAVFPKRNPPHPYDIYHHNSLYCTAEQAGKGDPLM